MKRISACKRSSLRSSFIDFLLDQWMNKNLINSESYFHQIISFLKIWTHPSYLFVVDPWVYLFFAHSSLFLLFYLFFWRYWFGCQMRTRLFRNVPFILSQLFCFFLIVAFCIFYHNFRVYWISLVLQFSDPFCSDWHWQYFFLLILFESVCLYCKVIEFMFI